MRVGEFQILVEGPLGQVVERITLVSTTGHPVRGEELEIDGRTFVVRRVSHQAEGGAHRRTTRRYSWTKLYVRQFGGRGRRPRRSSKIR